MLKNYFKIAWRNLLRNKISSFINIGGLAVGMTVAMLIGLWVYDEISFNQYHENYDQIVQLMRVQTRNGEKEVSTSLPLPLGSIIQASYSNDFKYLVLARKVEEHTIAFEDKKFTRSGSFIQADAPEMLTLKMIQGNRAGLKDLNAILLSETLAKTLFGNDDPMDQFIKIDNKIDAKVTGVYADLPNNSEFKDAAFIASFEMYVSSTKTDPNDWGNFNTNIYAQLTPNADIDKINAKIKDVLLNHVEKERKPQVFLHPMRKWHLYSSFENGVIVTSAQMKFIWFYGTIGLFVLLLACINFMNLSTARSEKRAKEVGIRKAIGSARRQLIHQFFSESFLTVTFAFIIAIVFVELMLPWFNTIADKDIAIPWINPLFWSAGLIFIFVTGLLAGSYPALYLSSFQAVKVLKGTFYAGHTAITLRKTLVVIQFTISIALIIGTIIVYNQIQFAKNRPIGYNQNGLITFQIRTPDYKEKYEVLRNELLQTRMVTEVGKSGSAVTGQTDQNNGFEWQGKDPTAEDPIFNIIPVNYEYGKTIGWQFVEGRDFSKAYSTDSSGIIVNEAAAKLMDLKNPIEAQVKGVVDARNKMNFKIIGVVQDMVMQSPFDPANPSIFFLGGGRWIFIRINPTIGVAQALPKIEAVFNQIIPSVPFDYQFVDEEYGKKFAAEERIGKLAGFFALLAIFISCLGLFGLASFVAEQRTKEIGIRKVLGASVLNLWQLLSKDFIILVMISLLIATPVAYYFMNQWIQDYTYRADISWWIFASAGAGALLIALLTVSFQAIRAAVANPVDSLKNE